MRVALYGGSFDPPHVAHVLAVAYLLAIGRFERVVVVPVHAHAFDKALAPYEDRVRMCELAFAFSPRIEVSRVEERLGGPSYTLRTIELLASEQPDWQLELVVGSDVLGETHRWHRFDRIQALSPLFVLGRRGHPHPAAPPAVLPEVSSTYVRNLMGEPVTPSVERELGVLVPAPVLEHARARGLYACAT
jgi:nicotinate-nucleotide adenylyltransferase